MHRQRRSPKGSTSFQRPPFKLAQPEISEQRAITHQPSEDQPQRHMRQLRRQRRAEAFARVDQRIDQHELLEPRQHLKRCPRIIGTTEEDHRSEQYVEHQPDLLRLNNRAHHHPKRREQPPRHERDRNQKKKVLRLKAQVRTHHQPGQRQDEQPVFDFFCPSEFDYQRKRYRLHARKGHAQSEDAREKRIGVTALHDAETRHHVTEYEREQDRLYSNAQEKKLQLAASDAHIAMKQRYHC